MKNVLAIVGVLVLAVAGFVGWQYWKIQQALTGPAKEIVSEKIEREGDVWHASFVSKLNYTPDEVWQAWTQPERLSEIMPDSFKQSKLVSSEGDKKVVDFVAILEILPPGFKVQNPRIEYTYFPKERRIVTTTIDFQLADITSEYKMEPADGGKSTVVRLEQQNKPKTSSIVESLQKGAIRESYITQVRAANKGIAEEKAKTAGAPKAG
jgi:hypothetical protein